MNRKIRNDCTVGSLAKKLGIPKSAFRNKNGRAMRSDKLVKTIRKELRKSS